MDFQDVIDLCVKRRKELGLSQRDLAKICGFPQSVIGRFETHVNEPQLSNLLKIFKALDIDVNAQNVEFDSDFPLKAAIDSSKKLTIGIFSPSSPISATVPIRYERGIEYLKSKGFNIIEGKLKGKREFYRSGSIKERAEELNDLIHNDKVDIIMSSIGGNNSNALLPYIDYEYLKKHPKMIVGYSDVTAVLLAIYAKTGLVTFYGPALAASFGEFPPFVDETYNYFTDILDCKTPYIYKKPLFWTDEFIPWMEQNGSKEKYNNNWITVREGVAEGRLIGGNLNTMEGFFGTEYMPEIKKGDILFIEDAQKNPSVIERSFSLLKNAGVFDKIGGLILGKHEKYDDFETNRKPHEILLEVLGDFNFPFLADVDCCHPHPMMTFPIGCRVKLDAAEQKITLLENPIKKWRNSKSE